MTSTVQPAPPAAVKASEAPRRRASVEAGRAHWSVKLAAS